MKTLNILSPRMATDPFSVYAMMREHNPVCRVEPGGMWALSRYSDVVYALKNPDIFSSKDVHKSLIPDWFQYEGYRRYLIALEDPPEHTQHRIPLSRYFIRRAIEQLKPFMFDKARSLLEPLCIKKSADFLKDFTHPFVSAVIGNMLGIEETQNTFKIRHWINLLEQGPFGQPDVNAYGQALEAITNEMGHFFSEVIAYHRQHPGKDLISELLTSEQAPFSDLELANVLELLTQAGYQPAVHLLSHALIALTQRPDIYAQLSTSIESIPLFIDEMLRYNSGLHLLFRRTRKKVRLCGVTIPEGESVILILASANRDPIRFRNPDHINLSRHNPKSHVAFGYGIHHCLGSTLARAEVSVALEIIVKTFKTLSIPDVNKLSWSYTLFSHAVSELPVTFTPY